MGPPLSFERAQDIPDGGVLLALPALASPWTIKQESGELSMSEGFYPLESIFFSAGADGPGTDCFP